MSYQLSNKTKELLSKRIGIPYEKLIQMEDEEIDAYIEQKTGKKTRIALNQNATQGLCCYMNSLGQVTANSYIFPGRSSDQHLSRTQAFRIIRHASEQLHFENKLSCHSMRKTFGYHAWKCGTPPAVLMDIYNHSSYAITKRYLGIEQDDKDDVFLHLNL